MSDDETLRVLGISGSLRKSSYNTALLHAAQELAPAGLTIEIFDLTPLPLYNEDVRAAGFPPVVLLLRDKIKAADALLFATPEYNYSMSGVLKNAIDWASRPPDQPFNEKAVAIMGASPSALGTGRAQYHLRQSCVYLNMHLVNKPEVTIAAAHTKFNEQGKLTDEPTRGFVRDLLVNLAAWTRRISPR
jgi:chromate reductase